LGVKGLLRLAAQKEGAKAQICLLRRTNYVNLPHKTNYTRGEKLLQQIFLRNLGGWFDSFDYAQDKFAHHFGQIGQRGIEPNAQVRVLKRLKTVKSCRKIWKNVWKSEKKVWKRSKIFDNFLPPLRI
jgi:hypothetical protein